MSRRTGNNYGPRANLTDFVIERRNGVGYRNTPTSKNIGHHKQPCTVAHCARAECGSWVVVEKATGKVKGRYRTFRNAWLKRKALMAGIPFNRARGLPS